MNSDRDPRELSSDNARFGKTVRGYRADKKHTKAMQPTQLFDHQEVKFGRYKRKKWADVPTKYLEWCYREFDPRDPNRALVEKELKRRRSPLPSKPSKMRRRLADSQARRDEARTLAAAEVLATWQPPEQGSIEDWDERTAEFLELVDCHPSEVLDCSRWQGVLPGGQPLIA